MRASRDNTGGGSRHPAEQKSESNAIVPAQRRGTRSGANDRIFATRRAGAGMPDRDGANQVRRLQAPNCLHLRARDFRMILHGRNAGNSLHIGKFRLCKSAGKNCSEAGFHHSCAAYEKKQETHGVMPWVLSKDCLAPAINRV